ncbi:hypothetical protein [Aestuariispira ectoiniformans]|uniref:hypothetical protein n=1 Tax=Aestuariispira ectoiniformans TaxID=2775080 RepID=UPI00223BFC2E|nr:hypothetical protein [Aestuariispira ectoiniformans]
MATNSYGYLKAAVRACITLAAWLTVTSRTAQNSPSIQMDIRQVIGLVAMVAGVIFLGLAYHSAVTPMERIPGERIDRYSHQTIGYFTVGIIAVVGGCLLTLLESRK